MHTYILGLKKHNKNVKFTKNTDEHESFINISNNEYAENVTKA